MRKYISFMTERANYKKQPAQPPISYPSIRKTEFLPNKTCCIYNHAQQAQYVQNLPHHYIHTKIIPILLTALSLAKLSTRLATARSLECIY